GGAVVHRRADPGRPRPRRRPERRVPRSGCGGRAGLPDADLRDPDPDRRLHLSDLAHEEELAEGPTRRRAAGHGSGDGAVGVAAGSPDGVDPFLATRSRISVTRAADPSAMPAPSNTPATASENQWALR